MESRLEELKQVIAEFHQITKGEFLKTTNSWFVCFLNSVSAVETLLNNSGYALANKRMEKIKRRIAELKKQYSDRNTVLPRNIKIELLGDFLSILLEEDEHVALSTNGEIMGRTYSTWHKCLRKYKQNRGDFLTWIKKNYLLQQVYYAGSGWDEIPKEILGEEVVVHLSLGPDNRTAKGYFTCLGSGIKIEGDFLKSPFRDSSFEAVFIHDTPCSVTIKALSEFYRVLKDGGILILDNGSWNQRELEKFLVSTQRLLEKQPLPSLFDSSEKILAQVAQKNTVIGIATSKQELEEMLQGIPLKQQNIVKQHFAVFRKNQKRGATSLFVCENNQSTRRWQRSVLPNTRSSSKFAGCSRLSDRANL